MTIVPAAESLPGETTEVTHPFSRSGDTSVQTTRRPNFDLSETESLRLQMAMDRRSMLIETLLNAISDTSDTIKNLR